jgi:hypothetical protein
VAELGRIHSKDDLVTYSILQQNFVDLRRYRIAVAKRDNHSHLVRPFVLPFICPHGTWTPPPDEFSLNSLVGIFTNICQYISILVKMEQK